MFPASKSHKVSFFFKQTQWPHYPLFHIYFDCTTNNSESMKVQILEKIAKQRYTLCTKAVPVVHTVGYLVCPHACTGVISTCENLPAILVMDLYYKCHAKLLLASSSALGDGWHHQSQHPMMVISPLSDQTVKLECHGGRGSER